MMNFTPDIPRYYTALAEWLAVMAFVMVLPQRFHRKRTWLMAGAALLVQTGFLVATGSVPLVWWLPCMMLAVVMMICFLRACCLVNWWEAIYYGMYAFVAAEFMASAEWQAEWFLWDNGVHFLAFWELLLVLGCYVSLGLLLWWMIRQRMPDDDRLEIRWQESLAATAMSLAVFAVSNLSFLTVRTPFTGYHDQEMAIIRTLVDWGGSVFLYSHLAQHSDLQMRTELQILRQILESQYSQYEQAKESVELINYKYHDLKHQIAVLRCEEDPQKRKEFLDEMEADIRRYEVQNKTGNKVLDTILTSKGITCAKYQIQFTCVADGALLGFMDTADICSIFGNALDNAISYEQTIADPEKRLIHVTVSRQKNFLMLRVENYLEKKPVMWAGIPISTKEQNGFHGYGIKSIRYTVAKYGGVVDIQTEHHWFDLQVMIPIDSP
jgi:hypothetical protein